MKLPPASRENRGDDNLHTPHLPGLFGAKFGDPRLERGRDLRLVLGI